MQLSDGSFPWFRGMSSNRYITQYIATGIARLQRLGVEAATSETANQILAKAVDYVDRQMKDDYDYLVKNKMDLSKRHMRRSEEHTSELQSIMRISYAAFCLKNTTYRDRTTSVALED